MPLYRLGKLREAPTVNSEVYKKQAIRYLENRRYYLKASSDVESTFADCVFSKKGEKRDYWMEAKATTVSLGEADFLSQLGKYLASYLSRTPQNRFKMILVCYKLTNIKLFEQVFDRIEPTVIDTLMKKIVESIDPELKPTVINAKNEEVKQFFEDTIIIEADFRDFQVAEEKIIPKPPSRPQLSDAEYATQILNSFGDVEPIKDSDTIWLNLFEVNLPTVLFKAKCDYPTAKSIFEEKPRTTFPIFDLNNRKIYSFTNPKNNILSTFIYTESVTEVELNEFTQNPNNDRILAILLNRWIKQRCRKKGLIFDDRTKSYYLPKNPNDDFPLVIQWKPRLKQSKRELTKAMKKEEITRYWVHRASTIAAKKLWGKFYIQIRPRFLFSPDGLNLFDGEKIDTLDRSFRKSIYSRNMNQLYDVLFWFKYVFPEADTQGNLILDEYLGKPIEHMIRIKDQIYVTGEVKPNIEVLEDIDKLEKIEAGEELTTLYDFMQGEDY